MAETVYSATREFDNIIGPQVVSVDAGTGSVVVAVRHGSGNWIDVETFSADAAKVIDFGPRGRVYRFTVTGDATFAL